MADGTGAPTVEPEPFEAPVADGAEVAPEAREAPAAIEGPAAPAPAEDPAAPAPIEPDAPTATEGDGPPVRVHLDRLQRRVRRIELSPTEALRLAREGRTSLIRRELPPDQRPEGSDADGPS